MDFINELKWRGMLYDMTPGSEELLREGNSVGYIGFDPTASSLTIGNYVQIMLLSIFQKSGHQPIALVGGATGRIGDPSGKDAERQLKSFDELEANVSAQTRQMRQFLDFDAGSNRALLINNFDFYKNMNVLDFLRDVGKSVTVNYMTAKESVKKRIETGISFAEFSYQLLQAYDFQYLFEHHNCTFQMGGSDQWGNITSGVEFIRKNLSAKAYAITTPLLTKTDGSKFGKSESGNIWLDPNLTSPYKFYQFWINADDKDILKFTRYFTFRSHEKVEQAEQDLKDDPRALKQMLAEELTGRVHSKEALEAVRNVSELLFNKKANRDTLLNMNEASLQAVSEEIPAFHVAHDHIMAGTTVTELLCDHTSILASKSELRRAIQQNALAVNKDKVSDHESRIGSEMLLKDKYILIENGKKNKYIIFTS